MSRSAPVAVTGAGCICAAGATLPGCVESMFGGSRQPLPPVRFSTGHSVKYPVFEVPEEFFPPELPEDERLSRTSRLAIAATMEALGDAGLDLVQLRSMRVGVCIGTTVGSAMNNEEFYREYRRGGRPDMSPIERFLRSNPAASVARHFGLTGPVQTVVNACASGTDAIGVAASWIRGGLCDIALAGGADELCRVTYNGFISLMISSNEPVRPFDLDRKGLNLGEGAAVMVLETDNVVEGRKRKKRSWVLGYGSSCDAYHLTAPKPDGAGLRQAIREAMDAGGCKPDEIAFVNAHGTGTPDNDRVEGRVIAEILPDIPFLSTKGFTGHTLGAAGAIEAAFTVACLEAGRVPASIGFETTDPEVSARPVTETTTVNGGVAISQSLAFGGNNAVIVLGKGER
ncbi:MAG: beta-ketoacyl-[acyl-carrier-protein] synthase family protein [Nitrospirota bacterium]|nr:beta-ketoacyl-[acyl-carrier-protein] synthase family protein [Nitrospirota bacterium]